MKTLQKSMIVLSVTLISACERWTVEATATESVICTQWGESLPSRSQSDTRQTQDEIGHGYAVFSLTCPDQKDLLPA